VIEASFMRIRHLEEADYDPIIAVVDEWWGGRCMVHMLPRLFFVHFRDTSFAVDSHGATIGFLAGFVSQAYRDAAYIHFVGVQPNHRRQGVARLLYTTFFEAVQRRGCRTVRCVTSPVNEASIAFHTSLGFEIEHVTGEHDGVPCTLRYELGGEHRVLFVKSLARGIKTEPHELPSERCGDGISEDQ
jgi:predicted GNAT superfamily acetyltransferase